MLENNKPFGHIAFCHDHFEAFSSNVLNIVSINKITILVVNSSLTREKKAAYLSQ